MRKLKQQQDSSSGSSNLLNYKEQIIEPVNYRQRVKNRFIQEVNQIVNKNGLGELVIVLDSVSAFLLSNIFTISQLVSMKILYIEKLEVKRKKLDKHALYFISPTKNNIEILNKDFPMNIQKEQMNIKEQKSEQTKGKKQKKQKQNKNVNKQKEKPPTIQQNQLVPQYRRIHILFTTFLDKGLLKLIAVNKVLLKRIAKNSLKQFYFSSRILAPNLIDMNMPYLALAYSKQSEQQVIRREYMCKKIIQFIANYTKISTIRIFYKKSANKVCDKVALTLEKVVKSYLGILLDNRSPYICKQAADITILLMDRSVDTVTPFIHYYTFQALLFDFFNISMVKKSQLEDKGAYSYQEIQNQVYDQFRYKHIIQALESLPEALQNTKGKLQSLKSTGLETINIKELNDKLGNIKTNLQKLQSIWKQFQTRKIAELGELEQCLGTGITDANVNTSSVKLLADAQNVIKDPNTPPQQRVRLAILCLSCIRMCKQDYQTLLDLFNAEEKKILKNMIALGVSYDGSQSKSTKTITKDQQKLAGQRMQKSGIPLDRYTSIVELVIPLFCKILSDPFHSNTIDKEIFGEIQCSIFNDQKQERQERKFNKQSFAMCMIGGMSWSQVSAIRNVPQLSNIVLMADSVMTAPQLIKQIGKINIISQ